MSILDTLKKLAVNKVTDLLKKKAGKAVDSALDSASSAVAGKIADAKIAAEAKAEAVKDAAADKAAGAIKEKANEIADELVQAAAKKQAEKEAKAAEKSPEELEAERKRAHEESEHIAKGLAELKGLPLDEAAPGSTAKKLRSGIEAFWQHLHDEWAAQKNEGYVWTITIDSLVELDVMGLVKAKYDLDLSASHVGWTADGVYAGEMAFKFDADLGGLNAMVGALGGRASTNHVDGWFRNDKFVMELTPYNKAKEDAFVSTLNYTLEQLGSPEEAPQTPQTAADAFAAPLLETMGSKPDAYELANAPKSYWFDWEYNMTEGDMSQFYSVTGILGIGSGWGSLNAEGDHLEAHGHALGWRDDISEDFHSPFPYVMHLYENGRVTFELHSQKGGPVVLIFRGRLDSIPVEQTILVK